VPESGLGAVDVTGSARGLKLLILKGKTTGTDAARGKRPPAATKACAPGVLGGRELACGPDSAPEVAGGGGKARAAGVVGSAGSGQIAADFMIPLVGATRFPFPQERSQILPGRRCGVRGGGFS